MITELNITPWMFIHFQAVQYTVVYFPADKFIREPPWQQSVVTVSFWYHHSRSNWSSWGNQWSRMASIIRGLEYYEEYMLKSILVDKIFQTWLLTGWQQAASQSEARFELKIHGIEYGNYLVIQVYDKCAVDERKSLWNLFWIVLLLTSIMFLCYMFT